MAGSWPAENPASDENCERAQNYARAELRGISNFAGAAQIDDHRRDCHKESNKPA